MRLRATIALVSGLLVIGAATTKAAASCEQGAPTCGDTIGTGDVTPVIAGVALAGLAIAIGFAAAWSRGRRHRTGS